jgi:IS30 family transposase
MKSDFENLQSHVQNEIKYLIKTGYSQASIAKAIGVKPKTVLFGLELSENMSWRKWMELAEGLEKLK